MSQTSQQGYGGAQQQQGYGSTAPAPAAAGYGDQSQDPSGGYPKADPYTAASTGGGYNQTSAGGGPIKTLGAYGSSNRSAPYSSGGMLLCCSCDLCKLFHIIFSYDFLLCHPYSLSMQNSRVVQVLSARRVVHS